MKEVDWYTFTRASLEVNKNKNYFSTLYRTKPEYFEGFEIKQIGKSLCIRKEDIEKIIQPVKKGGVHVNTNLFVWTQKNRESILPTPPNALV